MKRFILLVTALLTSSSYATTDCETVFGHDQLVTMQKAYDYGKPYGLEYSLAAITWKESSAGRHNVRIETFKNTTKVSYSPFHILLRTAMVHEGCETKRCASDIANKLMTNFDYAASHAVLVLQFWQRQHNNNWMKTWQGYNDGYQNSQDGRNYALNIKYKIAYLKQCVRLK
ncbi:hypothetical protein [Vibrio phage BX-1]|nr:hypothetical protein [Vibrio phage BX-1]